MNKEVILMLSELKSQIDDTIRRVEKKRAAESENIISTLDECEHVMLDCSLIFPHNFLDWCLSHGFLSITAGKLPPSTIRYVSRTDLIRMNGSDITVHPSLMYVYLKRGENE